MDRDWTMGRCRSHQLLHVFRRREIQEEQDAQGRGDAMVNKWQLYHAIQLEWSFAAVIASPSPSKAL